MEELDEGKIIKVAISRPKSLNAMNPTFFKELEQIFTEINDKPNARVAILVGEGKIFTAGLDLKEFGSMFSFNPEEDAARFARILYDQVHKMQKVFLSIVECRVPVIVGIHGKCVGGGVDLTSMCDIRYCTADTEITIKEIDIGMAADLGTLQYFPNIVGN